MKHWHSSASANRRSGRSSVACHPGDRALRRSTAVPRAALHGAAAAGFIVPPPGLPVGRGPGFRTASGWPACPWGEFRLAGWTATCLTCRCGVSLSPSA